MTGVLSATTALAGLLAAILGIFKYFNYRSERDQKAAVGEAFGDVVSGLSGSDSVERLASALLLRRFFTGTSEYAKPDMPYADDAIGVIAATLREEPTGNVQKVLADGLAFVETVDNQRPRRAFRRLAAGQGLQHRDFQRANFRSAYLSLEGPAGHRPDPRSPGRSSSKKATERRRLHQDVPPDERPRPRLDLSGSDFFRADLSHASLKNDLCAGTVFYECVAVHTVFRKADLSKANFAGADVRNADFREAVLADADFTGAQLTGANFEGATICRTRFRDAIGLPEEFAARMQDDGRVTIAPGTELRLKQPTANTGTVSVFLSIAAVTDAANRPVVELVTSVLRDEGFEVVQTHRDDYQHDRHLVEVRQAMATCSGVIVIGLPQLLVESGVWRRGTHDERTIVGAYIHTPWNDIEAGLGVGLGFPVLAIRVGCGRYGVFDLPSDDVAFQSVDLTERWATDVLVEGVRNWARVMLHG